MIDLCRSIKKTVFLLHFSLNLVSIYSAFIPFLWVFKILKDRTRHEFITISKDIAVQSFEQVGCSPSIILFPYTLLSLCKNKEIFAEFNFGFREKKIFGSLRAKEINTNLSTKFSLYSKIVFNLSQTINVPN